MQLPLFAVAMAMIAHGLFGPQLAPRNLATLLTWVHYRGALVLVLLAAGNLFCMACPFMLPRTIARRFFKPVRRWPRWLRSKWLSLGLFVLILYAYELFDLWSSPWWTAWLIVAYFAAALTVDSVFKDASFCKFVCPIGQFNFVASTVSPLEVRVRDADACVTCETHDCIKGTRDPVDPLIVLQQGCELGLFLPKKVGNMDCTFCLDCVHACPHDNVVIATRVPASELWIDPRRSGVGLFSRRKDLAALAIVFAFGALVNAFGMVSPVYAVEEWLAHRLGTTHEAPVLGVLFLLLLVVEPVVLLALAAWLTRRGAGTREPLVTLTNRFAYGRHPAGFRDLAGPLHLSLRHQPVDLRAGNSGGSGRRGAAPRGAQLAPHRPAAGARPSLELGFLSLGLLGSLLVAHRIAARDYPVRTARAFVPWAGLFLLLTAAALWLLYQPMEMRGAMILGG